MKTSKTSTTLHPTSKAASKPFRHKPSSKPVISKVTGEIINNDGNVKLSTRVTHAGGDFNWSFDAHYWTPGKEKAEKYRKYAARRCPTVVYKVPGVIVAKGFEFRREKEHGAGQNMLSLGQDVRFATVEGLDAFRVEDDIVFAYQLIKIEVKGWKGYLVELDELRHKAACLSTDYESKGYKAIMHSTKVESPNDLCVSQRRGEQPVRHVLAMSVHRHIAFHRGIIRSVSHSPWKP